MRKVETHQETSRQNYSIVAFQAEMTVRYCKSQVTLWAFLNHRRFFHRRHLCESFTTTSDGEAIMRSQKDCLDNYGALQWPSKLNDLNGTMEQANYGNTEEMQWVLLPKLFERANLAAEILFTATTCWMLAT